MQGRAVSVMQGISAVVTVSAGSEYSEYRAQGRRVGRGRGASDYKGSKVRICFLYRDLTR
jgi:hypothetical protein